MYVVAAVSAFGGLLFGYDPASSPAPCYSSRTIPGSRIMGANRGRLAVARRRLRRTFGRLPLRPRRATMTAVTFLLGSLASALVARTAFLAAARFVLGLDVGGAGMVVPVYIAESSPSRAGRWSRCSSS